MSRSTNREAGPVPGVGLPFERAASGLVVPVPTVLGQEAGNLLNSNGEEQSTTKEELIMGRRSIPARIGVCIWDIDGTITVGTKDKGEIPDDKIIDIISRSASKGTFHVFITGRNYRWMLEKLKPAFAASAQRLGIDAEKDIFPNLSFDAEVGLLRVDVSSEEPTAYPPMQKHPLVIGNAKDRLGRLFLDEGDDNTPGDLPMVKGGERPTTHPTVIVRNADGREYYAPIFDQHNPIHVLLPHLTWSRSKDLMGTAEVLRDRSSHIPEEREKKIIPASAVVQGWINYWGLEHEIAPSPVSSAINIVPILNGRNLDKDWAAGNALVRIQKILRDKLKIDANPKEIADITFAFGDGLADMLFGEPKIDRDEYDIGVAYVGPEDQLDKNNSHLAIYAKGYKGAAAVRDILEKHIEKRLMPLGAIKAGS
jgi:hypothetical protein